MKFITLCLFMATAISGGLKCSAADPDISTGGEVDTGYTLTWQVFRCPTSAYCRGQTESATKAYLPALRSDIPNYGIPDQFEQLGQNAHSTLRASLAFFYGSDQGVDFGESIVKYLIDNDDIFRGAVVANGYNGVNIATIRWGLEAEGVVQNFFPAISRRSEILMKESLSVSGFKIRRNVMCLIIDGPAVNIDETYFGVSHPGYTRGAFLLNAKGIALAVGGGHLEDLRRDDRICPATSGESETNFFVAGSEVHEIGHLLTRQLYHHTVSGCCGLVSVRDLGGQFYHRGFCDGQDGHPDHWARIKEMVVFNDPDIPDE